MTHLPRLIFAVAVLLSSLAPVRESFADSPSVESSAVAGASGEHPPFNVIFDTDMWSDIDDALALAMLHALQERHELNLVAVTVGTEDKWCASYVDLIDTFYGHPHVPVGLVRHGLNLETFRKRYPSINWPVTRYTQILSEKRDRSGRLAYPTS